MDPKANREQLTHEMPGIMVGFGIMFGMDQNDIYVGNKSLSKLVLLSCTLSSTGSLLCNDMETICHTFYYALRVAPEAHPVLLRRGIF